MNKGCYSVKLGCKQGSYTGIMVQLRCQTRFHPTFLWFYSIMANSVPPCAYSFVRACQRLASLLPSYMESEGDQTYYAEKSLQQIISLITKVLSLLDQIFLCVAGFIKCINTHMAYASSRRKIIYGSHSMQNSSSSKSHK